MKFAAVLIAACVATVSAADCDPIALVNAATKGNGAQCTAETTYSPVSLKAPSADILPKVCNNAACQGLLADVLKVATPDCTFSGISIKAALLDPIAKACEPLKTPAPGPAPGPAPTPAPGPGPAPGPAPVVTPSPAC